MNWRWFIEFRTFGWNTTTIGLIGTVIFTIIQGWGLAKQFKTIKDENSSASIPLFFYGNFVGIYLAFCLYGCRCHSFAIILNGLLGFWYLCVYIAAIRAPDSKPRRIWHGLFITALPLMIVSRHPQALIGVILFAATGLMLQVPYEIVRAKSRGAVDLHCLFTLIASPSFWIVYAVGTRDWAVFAPNVAAFAIMGTTILLWFKYPSHAT